MTAKMAIKLSKCLNESRYLDGLGVLRLVQRYADDKKKAQDRHTLKQGENQNEN